MTNPGETVVCLENRGLPFLIASQVTPVQTLFIGLIAEDNHRTHFASILLYEALLALKSVTRIPLVHSNAAFRTYYNYNQPEG